MCSYAEWERLARRVEEAVEEGEVEHFISDALARIDALLDSVMGWACVPEDADPGPRPWAALAVGVGRLTYLRPLRWERAVVRAKRARLAA